MYSAYFHVGDPFRGSFCRSCTKALCFSSTCHSHLEIQRRRSLNLTSRRYEDFSSPSQIVSEIIAYLYDEISDISAGKEPRPRLQLFIHKRAREKFLFSDRYNYSKRIIIRYKHVTRVRSPLSSFFSQSNYLLA